MTRPARSAATGNSCPVPPMPRCLTKAPRSSSVASRLESPSRRRAPISSRAGSAPGSVCPIGEPRACSGVREHDAWPVIDACTSHASASARLRTSCPAAWPCAPIRLPTHRRRLGRLRSNPRSRVFGPRGTPPHARAAARGVPSIARPRRPRPPRSVAVFPWPGSEHGAARRRSEPRRPPRRHVCAEV